ncbi:ADP-heptose:LPS heptosyltransferase [Granulicella rosea]|uniref:ADP-heptose:LPS heptosyltransferase n=1 Tax=Granulicella rosea TaxID=474952 RepID=A0A239CTU2_9BACT|nr:glycosyltransferase family 9 protein [Granulicella rosea]SNS23635.1 ADP-heptose:LPS heptosyltransferase [Granulicella rosea]
MKRGSKLNRLMDLWVGTPLLNALATVRHRRKWPSRVERIGVMCSPALGDTLLFSAVLRDLRAAYPQAHITHICMPQNLAAAEIIPGADTRVRIELTKPLASVRAIRACRFDILLDFSSWQRLTAFYTMQSGARFTAGFRTAGQHRGRGYDLAVEHRNDRHELENFRALLRGLGIVTGAEPQVILAEPQAEPLPGEGDMIVFHLWASGARSWLREWPSERWIELARRIGRPGTLFVVTGAPSDMERMQPFVAQMQQAGLRAVAFRSPDGFVSLVSVLHRARLAVSVNTGVLHLAAIAGAPTLGLNGPTANHRWGPVGRCVLGIGPADGSGGFLNLGFEYDGHPEDTMERVTVDQAVAAARDLIGRCRPVLEDAV